MAKPILTLPCKYQLSDFEQRGDVHHCASCDHSLKDFRHSTNDEIGKALSEANGKTCGIFHAVQVEAKTTAFQLGLQRRMSLSLLGILGFIAPAALTSCNTKATVKFPEEKSPKEQEAEAFSKLKFPMNISGRLTERYSDNLPLAMATIRICHGKTVLRTTQTDTDGHFSITLEKSDLKTPDFELVVERLGYESQTVDEVESLTDYKRKHLSIALKAQPKPVGEGWFSMITAGSISGMLEPGYPYWSYSGPEPVSLEPVIEASKDQHDN